MATDVAPSTDLSSVDLTDLEHWTAGPPHALFARMRADTPVRWNPSDDGMGFWSLTRGAEITEVSTDPTRFSSARGGIFLRPDALAPLDFARNFPIFKDPPDHTRYRDVVAKAFLPRTLVLLDEVIQNSVTSVLDKVVARGECDLVRDVAVPIPLLVIGRLLGSSDDDVEQLLAWTDDIERGMTYSQDVTPTFKEMAGHFLGLVNNQLVRGVDSLAKSIGEAEVDGKRLTEEEIAVYFGMLLYAGNGPTRAAISSGMHALMEHPEQFDKVRAKPTLLRCTRSGLPTAALSEILRWSTPVNYFARTAATDTSLGGVDIKADDRVVMWYASANRDPDVITDPDRFDIDRPVRDIHHLAFGGGGPHHCHAAFLAVKTLSVVLPQIIMRLPDIHVAGEPSWVKSAFINSLASLPVKFTPSE
ncbi:MAG TPA: cytochrome P450 [Pseudonocardia sp.]|jgi:cytochrome P450|nr:cytochrome P450 [Pseudonocardia sp.]